MSNLKKSKTSVSSETFLLAQGPISKVKTKTSNATRAELEAEGFQAILLIKDNGISQRGLIKRLDLPMVPEKDFVRSKRLVDDWLGGKKDPFLTKTQISKLAEILNNMLVADLTAKLRVDSGVFRRKAPLSTKAPKQLRKHETHEPCPLPYAFESEQANTQTQSKRRLSKGV